MGLRLGLPKSKKTAPLLVVVATGIAVSVLNRSADAAPPAATGATGRAAAVSTAWKDVAGALDAYQTFARSSAQDRPSGDAGLPVVRAAAQRSRTYLDAVDAANRGFGAVTASGLPSKASGGLPGAATAGEAGGAVAAWVDAQRTQSLLVTTCLTTTRTLAAAQACFRDRVDPATQESWLAAATRVGKARADLEKELGRRS